MAPQVLELLPGELEHEVPREPFGVTFHSAQQRFRLDLIETGEIRVEHHLLAADDENPPLNPLNRYQKLTRHSVSSRNLEVPICDLKFRSSRSQIRDLEECVQSPKSVLERPDRVYSGLGNLAREVCLHRS